ncbi:hypothetical protein D3C77_465230 [compost metagenome]
MDTVLATVLFTVLSVDSTLSAKTAAPPLRHMAEINTVDTTFFILRLVLRLNDAIHSISLQCTAIKLIFENKQKV